MKHKVLFVHGFGVKKDARGLFTDIANSLEGYEVECILTDLNIVNQENGDIVLNPLSKQAEILKSVYTENHSEGDTIDIIAHSQGCVVAALADLPQIRKIIFITPPTNNDLQKTLEHFKNRPDTVIDFEGESYITRADGSRTIAYKEYWSDRKDIVYLDEYKKLASNNDLHIIIANQDETVSNDSVGELQKIGQVICLDGDHNFTKEFREPLIKTIKKLIV